MDTYWAALQQSMYIIFYPVIPWVMGVGIAASVLLSVVAIIGRLWSKYLG